MGVGLCLNQPELGRKSGSPKFALTEEGFRGEAQRVTSGILASAQDWWIPFPHLCSMGQIQRGPGPFFQASAWFSVGPSFQEPETGAITF